MNAKKERLIECSDLRAEYNEQRGNRCLQPRKAILESMT